MTASNFSFQRLDTQGFIMHDSHSIVLSFRGTEFVNPKDWATDVNVHLTPLYPRGSPPPPPSPSSADLKKSHSGKQTPDLKRSYSGKQSPDLKRTPSSKQSLPTAEAMAHLPMVHAGFSDALGLHLDSDSPFTEIVKMLNELYQKQPRKIWVTGHSLGAALASVFTAQLLVEKDPLLQKLGGVYTYGQPRCGNEAYCDLFSEIEHKGIIFRVENKKDIVTRIPMKLLSYRHHGYKASIHSNHRLTLSTQKPKKLLGEYLQVNDHKVKNSHLKTVVFVLLPKWAEDHYPCEYVRNIEKFI